MTQVGKVYGTKHHMPKYGALKIQGTAHRNTGSGASKIPAVVHRNTGYSAPKYGVRCTEIQGAVHRNVGHGAPKYMDLDTEIWTGDMEMPDRDVPKPTACATTIQDTPLAIVQARDTEI